MKRKLRKSPFNDYVAVGHAKHSFVLEGWGDYVVAEPLSTYLPDDKRKKIPGDAMVRITIERVRPLTERERGQS